MLITRLLLGLTSFFIFMNAVNAEDKSDSSIDNKNSQFSLNKDITLFKNSVNNFGLSNEEILWLEKKDMITVGFKEFDLPYLVHQDVDAQPIGVLPTLISLMFQRLNIKTKLHMRMYDSDVEMFDDLDIGVIDVVPDFESVTMNRNKYMYSKPLLLLPLSVITRNDIDIIDKNINWGCQKNSYPCNVLKNKGILNIQYFDSIDNANEMLLKGNVDAFISYNYLLASNRLHLTNTKLIHLDLMTKNDVHLVTNNKSELFNNIINKMIDSILIKNKGIYNSSSDILEPLKKLRKSDLYFTSSAYTYLLSNKYVYDKPFDYIFELLNRISTSNEMKVESVDMRFLLSEKSKDEYKSSIYKIDIFPVINPNPELKKSFLITQPFDYIDYITIKSQEKTNEKSSSNLNIGMLYQPLIDISSIDFGEYNIIEYKSIETMLRGLKSGEIERLFLRSNFYNSLNSEIDYLSIDSEIDKVTLPISLAIDNNNIALYEVIVKALDRLPFDKLLKIEKEEFTIFPSDSNVVLWRIVLFSALISLISLILFLYVNVRKKLKLNEKLKYDINMRKDFLENAIDNISSVIYVKDFNGKLILSNKSYSQQIKNRLKPDIATSLNMELDDSAVLEFDKKIDNVAIFENENENENENKSNDFIYSKSLFKDRDNKNIGILTVLTDVSEIVTAKRIAEKAQQARSNFLATMSHELRTPIAGLHSLIGLLDKTKQSKVIDNLIFSTEHLNYLVNDILDYSQIEAGQLKLVSEESELMITLSSALHGLNQSALEKGLEFNLTWVPYPKHTVVADATRINQILVNIVSNAIKFTSEGSISILLDLSPKQLIITVKDTGIGIQEDKLKNIFNPFEQGDSSVNRKFGGTGLGLSICKSLIEEMKGKIDLTSNHQQGTEVEMFIPMNRPIYKEITIPQTAIYVLMSIDESIRIWLDVWKINYVEITDESQLYDFKPSAIIITMSELINLYSNNWLDTIKNSPFNFIVITKNNIFNYDSDNVKYIDIKSFYPNDFYQALKKQKDHINILNHNDMNNSLQLSGNILVAEDHSINQFIMEKYLSSFGLDYTIVNNGAEAIELLKYNRFDLLITDCHMPYVNGYQLVAYVRKSNVNMKIIGMTADLTEIALNKCLNSGVNDMLSKPFSTTKLYGLLAQYLPSKKITIKDEPLEYDNKDPELTWLFNFDNINDAKEMATVFIDSIVVDSTELILHMNSRNWEQVSQVAHRIKGAMSMIGLTDLEQASQELQDMSDIKCEDSINSLSKILLNKLNLLSTKIHNWL